MFAAAELAALANLRLDAAGVAKTPRAARGRPPRHDQQRPRPGRRPRRRWQTSAARAIAAACRDQGYDLRGAALAGLGLGR